MIAAAVWVGAAVGLWFFLKRSPKHPFRSIREFRRAGRKLAEPIAYEPDPSIRIVEASGVEPSAIEEPSAMQEPSVTEEPSAIKATSAMDIDISVDQLELFRPRPLSQPNGQDEFVREETSEADAELEEINHVIESVTSEKAPRPKRNRQTGAPARKRTAAMNKPARKIGKLTYVVVDEEGKPESDPG